MSPIESLQRIRSLVSELALLCDHLETATVTSEIHRLIDALERRLG
jgi:hypothetical protein